MVGSNASVVVSIGAVPIDFLICFVTVAVCFS